MELEESCLNNLKITLAGFVLAEEGGVAVAIKLQHSVQSEPDLHKRFVISTNASTNSKAPSFLYLCAFFAYLRLILEIGLVGIAVYVLNSIFLCTTLLLFGQSNLYIVGASVYSQPHSCSLKLK